jgi:hypothetical protein
MTAYNGKTQTTLSQLWAPLWDAQSQPDVIQPGFEPGTVVIPLALRCRALDRCTSSDPNLYFFVYTIASSFCISIQIMLIHDFDWLRKAACLSHPDS